MSPLVFVNGTVVLPDRAVLDGVVVTGGGRIRAVGRRTVVRVLAGRRDPDPREYRRHVDLGITRIATCAAARPGVETFCRDAWRRPCFSTCGHSNAT